MSVFSSAQRLDQILFSHSFPVLWCMVSIADCLSTIKSDEKWKWKLNCVSESMGYLPIQQVSVKKSICFWLPQSHLVGAGGITKIQNGTARVVVMLALHSSYIQWGCYCYMAGRCKESFNNNILVTFQSITLHCKFETQLKYIIYTLPIRMVCWTPLKMYHQKKS